MIHWEYTMLKEDGRGRRVQTEEVYTEPMDTEGEYLALNALIVKT